MTTTTGLGITVKIDESYNRPFIVIDIPTQLWKPNELVSEPTGHRRFAGTVVVNGVPMHLHAIQVADVDDEQSATDDEYTNDLNALSQLQGESGPFHPCEGIEAGQEFVLYAFPYER